MRGEREFCLALECLGLAQRMCTSFCQNIALCSTFSSQFDTRFHLASTIRDDWELGTDDETNKAVRREQRCGRRRQRCLHWPGKPAILQPAEQRNAFQSQVHGAGGGCGASFSVPRSQ